MRYITTLTRKGQLTVPKDVRRKLHLRMPARVVLEIVDDNLLRVQTPADIVELAGTFKPRKRTSVLEGREAFERSYRRR